MLDDLCADTEAAEPALEKVLAQSNKKQSEQISKIAIQHNIKSDDPVWVLLQIVQSLEQVSQASEKHTIELQAQKEKILAELKLDTLSAAVNDVALVLDEKSDELIEIMRAETQKNRSEMAATYRQLKVALEKLADNQSETISTAAVKSINKTRHEALRSIELQANRSGESLIDRYALPIAASMISSVMTFIFFYFLILKAF